MASEGGSDFYQVLGLNKDCSPLELRNAYKKLALQCHPDRCSASGEPKFIEESKKNFQAVQEAYSVLSDENKRLLYDIGIYDNDDDDKNDMGDFLGELVGMMNKTKPADDGQQSFEDLKNLFQEMYQNDEEFFDDASSDTTCNMFSCSSYSNNFTSNKKSCSSMSPENTKSDFNMESLNFSNFCVGVEGGDKSTLNSKGRGSGRRTAGRKHQKVSSHQEIFQ